MAERPESNPIKRAARDLAKQGLKPLPVEPGQKHPYLQWTKYRDKYSIMELVSEFTAERGLWTIVGSRIGYIVLDCDNAEAVALWAERLGAEVLQRTARVKTRNGYHYWFKVELGVEIKGWKHASDKEAMTRGARYDVQADGQGVMLPPSRHADDRAFTYEWEVLLEAALDAPAAILAPPNPDGTLFSGTPTNIAAIRDKAKTAKTGRSLLAALLLNPPDAGGRNDWHAKVAGHLINMNIPFLDAFEAFAIALNRSIDEPEDTDSVLKTYRHRWDQAQEERVTELGTPDSGMLSGNGTSLFTVIKRIIGQGSADKDADFVFDKSPWANADVIAVGVIDSDVHGRTYIVRIQRDDGLVRNDNITPGMLGNANDTNKWLAKHGVSVMTPKAEYTLSSGHVGQRILRYLEWQKPDAYRSVNYLGWHADIGFVTHEGIITRNGMRPHEGVMPDVALKDLAPYHYGMGDPARARAILREVLTYQAPEVAAVFGAWWAATLLKGHIADAVGHFPYFLINAASEAGKTRGFFQLMRTMAGSTKSGIGTKASTRDYIASHRNGIVHIDDPDNTDQLGELLRAASGEATISKKGPDNKTTIEAQMVAPILLSGESLGLSDEKAHRDRSISIDVPSPVGRMSTRDATRPQIDDIKELEHTHPNLTEFAGTYVHQALFHGEPMIGELATLRGPAGRTNEVKAVVRLGARVLAQMVAPVDDDDNYDPSWLVEMVDFWAASQEDRGAANTVLIKILPWALNHEFWRGSRTAVGNPPAFITSDGEIWVCVERLAAEWRKECQRQGIRDRLATDDAIRAQLRAIGASSVGMAKWIVSRKDRTEEGASGQYRRARYIQIPAEYASLVLGEDPGQITPDDDGEEPSEPEYSPAGM